MGRRRRGAGRIGRITRGPRAPLLWIADRSLEDVSAKIRADRAGGSIQLTAGEQVSISVEAKAGGQLSGRARVKDLKLQDLFVSKATKPPGARC